MSDNSLIYDISCGIYDVAFKKLYGNDCDINSVRCRYTDAVEKFLNLYSKYISESSEIQLFSVPGRSEVCGNHTDHNCGCVLAASISLDIIAVAVKTSFDEIRIKSEGFTEDIVSLKDCGRVREDEKYKASAIIRGVCDGFLKNNLKIGGFVAFTTSNVLKGSGLSSSAAFEVMAGNILNHLYNQTSKDGVEIAKISGYAENVHFGKPCGLMDQIACAVGGFVSVDFKNPQKPVVTKINFDIEKFGYSLCIINTGGNHADLNEEYASIPNEMKSVAALFGKEVLRETSKKELLENINKIRNNCSDRAFLRALHFHNENLLVQKQTENLKNNDIKGFLEGIKTSGMSSANKLQNIFTVKNSHEQSLSLALALAEEVLDKYPDSAYRVHGGGFAGTIQVFCKNSYVHELVGVMDSVFGNGASYVLNIRTYGAVRLGELL